MATARQAAILRRSVDGFLDLHLDRARQHLARMTVERDDRALGEPFASERQRRRSRSTIRVSQPTRQTLSSCRATTAACDVRPPAAVTMPAAAAMPGDVLGRRVVAHENRRAPGRRDLLRPVRVERNLADGNTHPGGDGAAEDARRVAPRRPAGARRARGRSSRADRVPTATLTRPSSTWSTAILTAAQGVRLPARVCSTCSLPSCTVNSNSCMSRNSASSRWPSATSSA